MELRIDGENYSIVQGEKVLASARLYRPYDALLREHGIIPNPPMPLVLTDLDGTGDAEAMSMLTGYFVELSKTTPIHCHVLANNPKCDKLLKVYKNLGGRPSMYGLLLGADDVE